MSRTAFLRASYSSGHSFIRLKITGWLAVIALCLPLLATAQTLIITNGVQTYSGLTNKTVTMTGHSELWITGTNNPLIGNTINLNSPDAWIFIPGIRPAAVISSILAQITVNGAAAIMGGNVRADEYVMGTVIIPHGPGVTPLQLFSAPNFLGTTMALGLYTFYTNTALDGLNRNVGSFQLKRGYMATFAQNADGSGASKVFVAQDGDLQVSLLSASLNYPVAFVRVFPWRSVAKRGWADTAGESAVIKPYWFYDWGAGGTSSANAEYVPMKWTASSGISGVAGKKNSTHALGYNEPDSSSQANLTVAAAITDWPSVEQWGLRVGAPAVSDSGVSGQGLDWLYSFMSQAATLNDRVDYIPIHFYKCGWNSVQLSNYLAGVYAQTGKPIWVTEFNYGANWCDSASSPPPTPAQEATAISQFINVLENAPFVERYSIYNWVTTNREMVLDDGTLTPAGILYRDLPTTLAYAQTLPAGGSHGIAQFHFESDTLDSSGYGNNGFPTGIPSYTSGHNGHALTLNGTSQSLQLPPTLAHSTNFTFAGWVYWNGGTAWQRIFDFGNDTSHYLFLSPGSGSGTLRFAINNGSGEQILETTGLATGKWQHIAVTLSGNFGILYTNGMAAASGFITLSPASFNPVKNYLGRSQFTADPLFNGSLDEIQIADTTFTATQIAALVSDQPPQFTTNFLDYGIASPFLTYSNNLTNTATDVESTVLTYSKVNGPTWLTVSNNGVVSGIPGAADGGTNYFTVRATDGAGASAFAVLSLYVPIVYANGIWTNDADGNWADLNNWNGGLIANGAGYTADFSTLNITSNRTVTLNEPHSLGTLKFGDTSGAQNWTLTADDDVLTLNTGSASTSPTIIVNQNTATIAGPLAGNNGFTKNGAGTLILSGSSSLSGTVYIDRNSSLAVDGITRAAHPTALLNVTNIQIRNNNSGSSTLQLDGSNGNVTSPASIALNARNGTSPAIENLSGSNTLSGGVALNVGGSFYGFESDAGVLSLGGILTSIASGNRTFTFFGNGDFYISGAIQNGVATNAVTKTGAGTLTLAGINTYTNTTTVSGGTLLVNGSTSTGLVNVSSGGTLGGNGTVRGIVTIQFGGSIQGGSSATIGTLTVGNAVNLQAGSFTRMKLNKQLVTNDVLKVAGAQLNYNGTLVVTNLAGTLSVGDSFKLFSAATYAGAFTSISPATPGPGLSWNATNLVVNGTLSVVLGNVNLQFGSFSRSGSNLWFSGSGGAAGAGYSILSATNLSQPMTNWNLLGGGNFDSNGNFIFTNPLAPLTLQQFFGIRIP
ncbi:MAG TPA: glycosyl hydrolase [Verrucomicrobiae bacterium]